MTSAQVSVTNRRTGEGVSLTLPEVATIQDVKKAIRQSAGPQFQHLLESGAQLYVYAHPLGKALDDHEALRGRWQLVLGSDIDAEVVAESVKIACIFSQNRLCGECIACNLQCYGAADVWPSTERPTQMAIVSTQIGFGKSRFDSRLNGRNPVACVSREWPVGQLYLCQGAVNWSKLMRQVQESNDSQREMSMGHNLWLHFGGG